MTVWIPTIGRPDNLRACVPAWLDRGFPVGLVTEEEHVNGLLKLRETERWGSGVHVIRLPDEVRGIGWIKNYIVWRANKRGHESIIFSEDDAVPEKGDFWELLELSARPDVMGIGAARAIYDFYTGGALRRNSGVIIYPGAAFVCYGLNIKNALKVGNYDKRLHTCQDDAELPRQGIAQLGIPWMLHCGVWWKSLNKRYAPGGVNANFRDLEARTAAEDECRAIVHDRWPKYMTPPGKRERMQWKKMLDFYIPDWKSKSAMHGGSLGWGE